MNTNDPIPFLDLVTPHKELEEELVAVFRKALSTASFVGGAMVEEFEEQYARFCGRKYCVGVSSGTDALRFALIASGVKAGDVVVTVPNTFIATTEAITQAGGQPEFVDIDESTYNMDPAKLQNYLENECTVDSDSGTLISRRAQKSVSAIVPVHLYGQMADMDPILELAEQYQLPVIEDACQAHGAEYFSRKHNRWFRAGSMGRAAGFSFYPGKNLGACGEAGAITTDDEELALNCRMLRDHGQAQKYYHNIEGYNGRLDAIQAGFLSVKLKHLPDWNAKRRETAAQYTEMFAKSGANVVIPFEHPWSKAVYHLYVIRCAERDRMRDELAKVGIGTGIHYPIPLHLQTAYHSLRYGKGCFPTTEATAGQILSLPMYPQLRTEQQRKVVEAVTAVISSIAPENWYAVVE